MRRSSRSIEREEKQRAELRRQKEEKRQYELKRQKELERERKREMRELTASASWEGEGPRPPGTDLGQYRHDRDMGYISKDKRWVYTPGETNMWYQKRTGRYYIYDKPSHRYVYSHGGMDPSLPQQPMEPDPTPPPAPVAVTTTTVESTKEQEAKQEESKPAPAKIRNIHYATESWEGRKDTLEDRYTEDEQIDNLGVFFGLFDGHGGQQCAEQASKRMGKHLINMWRKRKKSGLKEAVIISKSFTEAFEAFDTEYCNFAKKKNLEDGSTAVCALLVGDFPTDDKPEVVMSFSFYITNIKFC